MVSISMICLSQDTRKTEKLNLPGDFVVNFGFNSPINTPSNFKTSFIGSRTFNLYYLHEFVLPVAQSRLSILPGVGLGLDRFNFSNLYTLSYEGNNLTMSKKGLDMRKSKLITNYFDIPVEIRYSSKPEDPSRGFKLSVGFKFGVLIDAFTKIKYYEGSSDIKDKSKREWNINKIRYGVYSKIGVGNFSVFSNFNMSPLFKQNKGPDDGNVNVLTTGISISGF